MIETLFRLDEPHALADQIEAGADRVHAKNIFNNANGGVTLLAFKGGQKLDEHLAPADVMINVIEGAVDFTISGTRHSLNAGDFILMRQGEPHSVEAKADSKVLLIKIKA